MTNYNLNYKNIVDACEEAARYLTPDLPKENTLESWEEFSQELENLDILCISQEEVEGWEWCIYKKYGFEILNVIPPSELHDAESEWYDLYGPSVVEDHFGPFEFASQVAYLFLVNKLSEIIQETVEQLQEMAQCEIDNRE